MASGKRETTIKPYIGIKLRNIFGNKPKARLKQAIIRISIRYKGLVLCKGLGDKEGFLYSSKKGKKV